MRSKIVVLSVLFCTALGARAHAEGKALAQLREQAGVKGAGLEADWRDPDHYRRPVPIREHEPLPRRPPVGNAFEEGHAAAVTACMSAWPDQYKNSCLQVANQNTYFQPDAAQTCGKEDFAQNIGACLSAIANKTYIPAEVSGCGNSWPDNAKVSCYQSAGRPYLGGLPGQERPRWERRPDLDSFLLNKLRDIRSDLERGNVVGAMEKLTVLISFAEEGSRP